VKTLFILHVTGESGDAAEAVKPAASRQERRRALLGLAADREGAALTRSERWPPSRECPQCEVQRLLVYA
jgi:hypothetical protein